VKEDESEILEDAKIVCNSLKKYGFSRYAATRPIHIISSAIIEAKKAGLKEDTLIKYATNRVLLLSSREIGREIKKEEKEKRKELKEQTYRNVKKLVKRMCTYFKDHEFKKFILLTRYLSDSIYVDVEFGGERGE